jgi:hypothetical protein
MKGTSNNGSWAGAARNRSKAKSLQLNAMLAALVAVAALLCLSGCASPSGGSSFEPGQYNPNTGYPAIGGGVPWHM